MPPAAWASSSANCSTRAAARRRAHRRRPWPRGLHDRCKARRRRRASYREPAPEKAPTPKVLATASTQPFQPNGGLKMLTRQSRQGGHQDFRRQAGAPRHRGAGQGLPQPGRAAGRLQGRRARWRFRRRRPLPGPEGDRHARTAQADAALGVLQDRGHKVALLTDGRMSGASGKVPAAIHMTPEAIDGGPIARSATATSSASTRPRHARRPRRRREFAARAPARTCRQRVRHGPRTLRPVPRRAAPADRGASVFFH